MVTWVLNVPNDHRPDPRACVAKQSNKDRSFNVLGDGEECHEIKPFREWQLRAGPCHVPNNGIRANAPLRRFRPLPRVPDGQ